MIFGKHAVLSFGAALAAGTGNALAKTVGDENSRSDANGLFVDHHFVPKSLSSSNNHDADIDGDVDQRGMEQSLLPEFQAHRHVTGELRSTGDGHPEPNNGIHGGDALSFEASELGVLDNNGLVSPGDNHEDFQRHLGGSIDCNGYYPLVSGDADFQYVVYECYYGYDCPYPNVNQLGCLDTSEVTDMSDLFRYGYYNYDDQGIGRWNTSRVTDMSGMFYYEWLGTDLSGWDVSSVTSMSAMFYGSGCTFGCNIGGWDVSRVKDMSFMFGTNPTSFGVDEAFEGWNVSSVTDMSFMFAYVKKMDRDISDWDISAVRDFSSMFLEVPFYQCLAKWAVKAHPDVNTAGMFQSTQCPYQPRPISPSYVRTYTSPRPGELPWCLGPAQECVLPSYCDNSPDPFDVVLRKKTKQETCQRISEIYYKDRGRKCNNVPEVAENCPGICDKVNCGCENIPGACEKLATDPPNRQARKCQKERFRVDCPGICDEQCSDS